MASAYTELVTKLWESWEPDAVERDHETGTYANYKKVHTIDFEGKYYKSRGPVNTAPSPQYRPSIAQVGASSSGRELAAQHADRIVAPGDSAEDAEAKRYKMVNTDAFITSQLGMISTVTDIDFSKFPLDEALPELTTNGEQGSLNKFQQAGSGKTLRQLATTATGFASCLPLVGTPEYVANQMAEAMEAVGGDGFLLTTPIQHLSRRYVTDITEGLVPALRDLGLVRESYEYDTLRENLLAF